MSKVCARCKDVYEKRLENVISELEERAKMLKDDWELDGYNELVFAITKLKQVIADENHHTRHTTRNE